jgi:enamine deaminase RidA (YjgF/YER057c/UK114 family)
MSLTLINPADRSVQDSYTQVVVATGTRLVFVAGQVADDVEGRVVGPGDLRAQAQCAFANLGRCLDAAGARPDQVARITVYVVDYEPANLPDISTARIALFGDHKPADTFLPVGALAEPGHLIEIEAIAVVD